MRAGRSPELRATLDRLYELFRDRPTGDKFCTFCWDRKELEHITTTPVRKISDELARKLLWEAADHWETADVYKHYLPRILEALAPPDAIEDLYPLHLFETLQRLRFKWWPEVEKKALYAFLDAVAPVLDFANDADREEWGRGCALLREPAKAPPTEL